MEKEPNNVGNDQSPKDDIYLEMLLEEGIISESEHASFKEHFKESFKAEYSEGVVKQVKIELEEEFKVQYSDEAIKEFLKTKESNVLLHINVYEALKKLKELRDKNIVTQEYFKEKKKMLLRTNSSSVRISKTGKIYYAISPESEVLDSLGNRIMNNAIVERGVKLDEFSKLGVSKEEFLGLGSKRSKLHFKALLGLESVMSTLTKKDEDYGRQSDKGAKPVGVSLSTDEDITVPFLEMKDYSEVGFDFEKEEDIPQRIVRKEDKEFHLSLYEFMLLMIRKEYAGFCSYEGNERGVYLSVISDDVLLLDNKGESYVGVKSTDEGKILSPIPTIKFAKDLGAIKAELTIIDKETEHGLWKIKDPQYERFSALIPKHKQDKEIKNDHMDFSDYCYIVHFLKEDLKRNDRSIVKENTYISKGKELVESLRDSKNQTERNRFGKLGSLSTSLKVVCKLFLPSKGRQYDAPGVMDVPVPIGFTFVSDININIPQIDLTKNCETGIDQTDLSYREVLAGEQFHLTDYESMYLLMQDEYAGVCGILNKKTTRVRLEFMDFQKFLSSEYKIPKPVLRIIHSKDLPIEPRYIYEINKDGVELKQGYERFEALLKA